MRYSKYPICALTNDETTTNDAAATEVFGITRWMTRSTSKEKKMMNSSTRIYSAADVGRL